jgi:hypothetical protein
MLHELEHPCPPTIILRSGNLPLIRPTKAYFLLEMIYRRRLKISVAPVPPDRSPVGTRATMAHNIDSPIVGNPEAPRVIRMYADDNVAIIANDFGLPAGAQLPSGPALRERVPQGRKVRDAFIWNLRIDLQIP